MLDRESACNRVFLARRFVLFGADGVGLRFEPARSFFKLAAAPRSIMSSPLPYYRTNQTSSDVGVIGMITASARHRCTSSEESSEWPRTRSPLFARTFVPRASGHQKLTGGLPRGSADMAYCNRLLYLCLPPSQAPKQFFQDYKSQPVSHGADGVGLCV